MKKICFNEIRNGRNAVIILGFNDRYSCKKPRYCHLHCNLALPNIPNILTLQKNINFPGIDVLDMPQ